MAVNSGARLRDPLHICPCGELRRGWSAGVAIFARADFWALIVHPPSERLPFTLSTAVRAHSQRLSCVTRAQIRREAIHLSSHLLGRFAEMVLLVVGCSLLSLVAHRCLRSHWTCLHMPADL